MINVPDAAYLIIFVMFTRTLTITWTSSRKWGLKNGWRREKGTIDGNEDGPRTGTWNYDADKCCEALSKQYNPTDTSLSVFSLRAKHFYAEFMELLGVLEPINGNQDVLVFRTILDHAAGPGGLGQLWKDVNIVITSARRHNLPLLVATATSHYFNMAVSQGMVNDESTRLMDVIRKMTGDPVIQDEEG